MQQIMQYAKTIAALLGAILTSVIAVIPDAPIWLTIALAVSTAVAVFVVPNAPTPKQVEAIRANITNE